jgi:hypothetical protein
MIPDHVVERALNLMKLRAENYRHFFDNAISPDWIQPLAKKGFFLVPPSVRREDGYVTLPIWPESRYLARCAPDSPDEVARMFLQMQDTDNSRVYEDMAEAALSMPMPVAAQLTIKLANAATLPYSFFLPERLTHLAIELLKAGFAKESTQLLESLLTLVATDQNLKPSTIDDALPVLEQHHFETVLSTLSAVSAPTLDIHVLALLINKICECNSITSNEGNTEYFWMTRPAIEPHEQNLQYRNGAIGPLIDATRDVAITLCHSGLEVDVISSLAAPHIALLNRIAMYTLTTIGAPDSYWLVYYLENKEHFASATYHHEYYWLLKRHFGKLPTSAQGTILNWIDEDDDPDEIRRLRIASGSDCSDQEAVSASSYRKLERLHPIEAFLGGDQRVEYLELLDSFGAPVHPDFMIYHYPMRWGSISPVQDDALATMDILELIEFMRNWRPSQPSFDGPTATGLAHQVEERVKASPSEFMSSSHLFIGLDSIYIRSLLSGVQAAMKKGTKPDWWAILDLVKWVVMQADEPAQNFDRMHDGDSSWSWTKKEVAHMLAAGLGSQTVEPPFGAKDVIWSLLELLAADPDPTQSYEDKYGGDKFSPTTVAINTIRPLAIRGVVLYALWAFRQSDSESFSFASIPEVDVLLARHLDSSLDPSLAVRSVYGELSPYIAKIDEKWFEAKKSEIFDRTVGREDYWHAAWDAYVTHCQPYDKMLGLLKDEYKHAIDLANGVTLEDAKATVSESLGVHLLLFYGRKQIDLGEGGLMNHFLEHTTPDTRKLGLVGLGQSLVHAGSVEASFTHRFISLWDRILENALKVGRDQRTDLTAYGWWFASGVFDSLWALNTLLKVLDLAPSLEVSHLVIEKLAELASVHPAQALRALVLLFQFQSERMNFYERTEIVEVLEHALNSESREGAVDFIHLLGAAGIDWPRKLLSTLPD